MPEGEEKVEKEQQEAAAESAPEAPNQYDLAEQGWSELDAAAEKIQKAANALKKSENSIDGYSIERALRRHKPELIKEHLRGLRDHRKETDR